MPKNEVPPANCSQICYGIRHFLDFWFCGRISLNATPLIFSVFFQSYEEALQEQKRKLEAERREQKRSSAAKKAEVKGEKKKARQQKHLEQVGLKVT